MRVFIIYFILFILPVSLSAQTNAAIIKIDSNNYYDHLAESKKTGSIVLNWLKPDDVIPIIKDEMHKAGYTSLKINYNYKLPADGILRITVYSEKASLGFYYINTHRATPLKSDRKNPALYLKDVAQLDILPKNIFPLNENVYWYEYGNAKAYGHTLVTKTVIENILRQDIRAYLIRYKHKF